MDADRRFGGLSLKMPFFRDPAAGAWDATVVTVNQLLDGLPLVTINVFGLKVLWKPCKPRFATLSTVFGWRRSG
jgi:hypothetical protein